MRARHRLQTILAASVVGLVWMGCGDDSATTTGTTGGGGSGGEATTTSTVTSTTGPTTTSTTTTTGTGGTGGQGGTGGNGGQGGTGGNELPPNDTCPGEALSLELGPRQSVQVTVDGSTVGATDDYASFCGDMTPRPDTGDVVYALTLDQAGSFELEVTGSDGLDVALAVQQTCGTDMLCFDFAQDREVMRQHLEAGTYYVIVDGSGMTEGSFSLTATLSAPTCGDAILNPGEDCDDGNTATGDGCDASCAFEMPPVISDTCPGEPIVAGATLIGPAFTTGYNDDYTGTCTTGTLAPDRVYHYIATATGTLTVSIGTDENDQPFCADVMNPGCWDRVLYVRSADCEAGTEVACSDDRLDFSVVEEVSVPVTIGGDYYIFVDGYDDVSYGNFYLHLAFE